MLTRQAIVLFLFCGFIPSILLAQEPATENWHGFAKETFKIGDQDAYVVKPKAPLEGKPWIWRARFPGFHIKADLMLLEDGYHLGYVDVSDMFGSPKALAIGDRFYEHMRSEYGLSEFPVLEGVSRGGLFVYNWAASHPNRVSCIYCDTPVCDIRSWPGGFGKGVGSVQAWKQCLTAYGLDEESAKSFAGNPLDRAKTIADANIPILHIVSENDQVVPAVENSYRLKTELEKHDHSMKLIKVQGTKLKGHHFDHPCPEKVAEFIKANTLTDTAHAKTLLSKAKRIIFLGDSVTQDGRYVIHFENWLEQQRLPNDPVVINMGLSSETSSGLSEDGHAGGRFPRPDLHERLTRVLETTKPDLVFACYGINCGIYQPFDEKRFEAFRNGINRLHKQVEASGAAIIHLTPPIFDDQRSDNDFSYDDVMTKYSAWLVNRRADGWCVFDQHTAMKNELEWRRELDPQFFFQRDGVHPTTEGQALLGEILVRNLGGGRLPNRDKRLAELVKKRSKVRQFSYLTTAGHLRPGVPKGVSIEEAEVEAEKLSRQIEELVKQP